MPDIIFSDGQEIVEPVDPTGPTTIAELMFSPKRVTGDEGTVEERSLKELIEADKYLNQTAAIEAVPYGLRIAKIRFPGTT